MKYILLDIEGTTTSINFVHKELFPYSLQKLDSYFKENSADEKLQSVDIQKLKQYILEDRKDPTLKAIQGHIWKEGYARGEIKGHVYEDVKKAFLKWKSVGHTIGIYSSGSVLAQKQLFENSIDGNLLPMISHHFDTAIGNKTDVNSYANIIKSLGIEALSIYFFSDREEELIAASEAKMNAIQVVRDGTTPSAKFKYIANLLEFN